MPEASERQVLEFGPFQVDVQARELRKQGVKIKVQGQPFQVLVALLERPGEVLSREELRSRLWPADTFVDFDNSLNAAINHLREALRDSPKAPRFIETLPRIGYRFVTPVRAVAEPRRTAAKQAPAGNRLVLTASLVALGLALTALLVWRAVRPPPALSPIRSVAVLPLENLSGDTGQEYFADGMTEALIADLSQISALRVISRTSVMQYKGGRKPLPQIAKELNVDGVVEGSVVRSGDRVRIRAQLIYAPRDMHLWAGSYERDLHDVLALQDDVAHAIANEIKIKVTPQEQVRLASARPVDPEAFDLYLQGRFYWNRRTKEGVKKAVGYMNQAIAKDPNYALAYAGLADCYVVLGDRGVIPGEAAYTKGVAAAQRALELDATLAEAHAARASFRENEFDWAGAEAEFKRAIELNPNYATGHQWYGLLLRDVGRLEEGRQQIEIARGLDPLSLQIQINVGQLYEIMRQFDRAIEEYRKIAEMDPSFAFTHRVLAPLYEHKGMYRNAAAEWEKALLLENEREMAALYEAVTDEASYRRAVRRRIALLKERAKTRYVSPMTMVDLFALLGDKDQAIAWLEKAYQEHATGLRYLKTELWYDPLRSDPRFQDLLRRLHFPP